MKKNSKERKKEEKSARKSNAKQQIMPGLRSGVWGLGSGSRVFKTSDPGRSLQPTSLVVCYQSWWWLYPLARLFCAPTGSQSQGRAEAQRRPGFWSWAELGWAELGLRQRLSLACNWLLVAIAIVVVVVFVLLHALLLCACAQLAI